MGTSNTLRTIDAHVGGEPVRLFVDGFPSPRGRTMAEKRDWLKRHADHLREALLLEPRGHANMCGAVLTEPTSPGSHAGLLFMHNAGYAAMSGHGIIAATTIALSRGLLVPGGDGCTVVYDTVAGTVTAHAQPDAVSFLNVPSFVLYGGLPIKLGHRQVLVDVAYGGEFYAIVDSEAVGLGTAPAQAPLLCQTGADIARAIESTMTIAHPLEAGLSGIAGTIFTGLPSDDRAGLRSVTIFANAQVDRSSSGTGTAAVMAVLDAMGVLPPEMPFVHEGLIGTLLTGRIARRTFVGECAAIVPEIEGSAWITGDHTFTIDDGDPLGAGFRV